MLNMAVKAARAAGAIINRAALDIESVRISQKQVNDFVTEVDQASEQAIIETILTAYPCHGILAEESGREHGAKHSQFVWIIDPLDGTNNFIHGFPVYCVSIALAVNGVIEQAVVYDPTRNDLFTATKGRGAYLNDRRVRVSRRTRLQESIVSNVYPLRPGNSIRRLQQISADLYPTVTGVRSAGSAALELAYVAAGFSDGFIAAGVKSWDIAAASLLVTEAGGLVGNFTGEADFLDQGECMAATPRVYGQLVSIMAKHSEFAGLAERKRRAPIEGEDAATAAAADEEEATAAADEAATLETPPVEAPVEPPKKTLVRVRKADVPRDDNGNNNGYGR
ncbi:MAG: Inositol-1-monophosphatase [Paracidovorax wautersii]|uniref:Inositol-1-monophosphatase n=1 Tax=Paracidovorax wautersii TaxID=1177982 RepID=A0A7V8FPG7_9BURK|nr:MAG: Inositol-1-monophosphatase [Paracidovorax wautersii]